MCLQQAVRGACDLNMMCIRGYIGQPTDTLLWYYRIKRAPKSEDRCAVLVNMAQILINGFCKRIATRGKEGWQKATGARFGSLSRFNIRDDRGYLGLLDLSAPQLPSA